jgi:hypothetical protein
MSGMISIQSRDRTDSHVPVDIGSADGLRVTVSDVDGASAGIGSPAITPPAEELFMKWLIQDGRMDSEIDILSDSAGGAMETSYIEGRTWSVRGL